MNKKVKINNQEISIAEYNRLYVKEEHSIFVEYEKLYKILFGSDDIDNMPYDMTELEWRVSEYKKSGGTNPNLFADLRQRVSKEIPTTGATSIWETDDPDSKKVKDIIQKTEALFNKKKEFVELGKQLWEQRQEPPEDNPDQDRNERNREAAELQAHKEKAIQEINNALNELPQINSSELENKVWQSNIEYSKNKGEIDRYKEATLTDINTKRSAKNGEKPKGDDKLAIFKRDVIGEIDVKKNAAGLLNESDLDTVNHGWRQAILEADSENKINLIKARVLADIRNRESKKSQDKAQAKLSAERIKQTTLEEINKMEDDKLKEAMELFTRWEGEDDFAKVETASQIEERLMREHPDVYRETIIDALIQRMSDYGITPKDLDEESQQILRGNITDVNKFKQIKDEAIKAIGTKGAKSQWEALMSQAQALLKKAKNAVTQQVEKDIKTIQAQIKNFKTKAGSNSYLSSIYNSNKTAMERMESDLNSCLNNQNTGSPKETPWGIIIPVSLVTVVAAVAAVIVIRRRRQAKIVE